MPVVLNNETHTFESSGLVHRDGCQYDLGKVLNFVGSSPFICDTNHVRISQHKALEINIKFVWHRLEGCRRCCDVGRDLGLLETGPQVWRHIHTL